MNDYDEARHILEFRYRRMTWKHWALVIAANLLFFAFLSAFSS